MILIMTTQEDNDLIKLINLGVKLAYVEIFLLIIILIESTIASVFLKPSWYYYIYIPIILYLIWYVKYRYTWHAIPTHIY
jgi:hypothetical protein